MPSTGRTYTVSLIERGREQPPGFIATAAPRPSRRVAHAPVSVSRSLAECRAICAPFARALSRAYTLQITRGSHCTFNTHLRKYSRCFGHHIVSVELCSVSSRLFATLRPAVRACGP
jgi:hypothetical protein